MEINLLGRKIQVRYVSDKELGHVLKDTECVGYFDGTTVHVSSSITQEQAKRVICHEIAHAVLSITGLTNIIEEKHEEAVCDAFESLVDVFNSPDLVSFLTKEEQL